MIRFNNLKIDYIKQCLLIDVEIDPLEYFSENYYKDCFIESIHIDTQETFLEDSISSKAIQVYPICDYDIDIVNRAIAGDEESIKLSKRVIREIPLNNNSLYKITDKDLMFIWVKAGGNPLPSTPCGMDKNICLGVVYNKKYLYENGINQLNSIIDVCADKSSAIDYILKHKYFDLNLKTGQYLDAIEIWNSLAKDSTVRRYKGCGCHG